MSLCGICVFNDVDEAHPGCLLEKTPVQHHVEDRQVCKFCEPDKKITIRELLKEGCKFVVENEEVIICGIRLKTEAEMLK